MNIKLLVVGLLGLVIGAVISSMVVSNKQHTNKTNDVTVQNHMMMESSTTAMTMDSMVMSLQGKSGDDFDKTFLTEMIKHHDGAVAMARLAQKNAKHTELKTMADAIISAQTTEIDQMKAWQKEWSY